VAERTINSQPKDKQPATMNRISLSRLALSSTKLSTSARYASGGFVQSTAWKRNNQPKILVTGAAGQIGLEIVP
jgi:hypothetical protein